MTLDEAQTDLILRYLESKGLYAHDLKHEVLDHMITAIEVEIGEHNTPFYQAFDLERRKWEEALAPYDSIWIGDKLKGPKILVQHYVAMIKALYLRTLILSVPLAAALFVWLKHYALDPGGTYTMIGMAYLGLLLFLPGVFFLRMHGPSSIPKKLFRANLKYYSVWLLVFNPLITKWYWIGQNGQWIPAFAFIHAFLICFALTFGALYRGHKEKTKRYKWT